MHEKLVRDGIPALAAADGRMLDTRTALDHELDRLLGLKLVEEAHEPKCSRSWPTCGP